MKFNVLILDMVSAPAGSFLATHLAVGFMDMQSRQVQLSLAGGRGEVLTGAGSPYVIVGTDVGLRVINHMLIHRHSFLPHAIYLLHPKCHYSVLPALFQHPSSPFALGPGEDAMMRARQPLPPQSRHLTGKR